MKLTRTRMALAAMGTALALAATGCAGDTDVSGGGGGGGDAAEGGSIAEDFDLSGETFVVGSKEFTENRILGQIAIAAIEAAGGTATDQTGISGSATVRAALTSGQIDLYWDYTGTGWVNYLNHAPDDIPDDLFEVVKEEDAANQVTWVGPSPLNNSYGIAVKKELAEAEGIETMSDMAEYINANPGENTLCAASEFIQRDDGLPGLEAAYGVTFSVVELDLSLVYPQVGNQCVFGEVTTTEARIAANDLVALEDDQKFFVPYNAAVTIRTEVADANPDLVAMFEEITAALDNETMMELNGEVDLNGEQEADVARTWLQDQGYID